MPVEDEGPTLLPQHAAYLQRRAVNLSIAQERGVMSIASHSQAVRLGFADYQAQKGLALRVHGVGDGRSWQIRSDIPRTSREGKEIKFEIPAGDHNRLDCHPRVAPAVGDPNTPLVVTEGVVKGDAIVSLFNGLGVCVIALIGVWGWRGTNEHGGKVALPAWNDVALNGRDVFIAFDSDITSKAGIAQAAGRLGEYLVGKGAKVHHLIVPPLGMKTCGIDDWLAHDLRKPEQFWGLESELPQFPDEDPLDDVDDLPLWQILDMVKARLLRFSLFRSDHESTAIALWAAHTYAVLFGLVRYTPRLFLTAPMIRSGKSRVQEVLVPVCHGSRRWFGVSAASLFRTLEARPTTFLDECDQMFGQSMDPMLNMVLCAGFEDGAVVPRSDQRDEKGNIVPKEWPVFGAICIAANGNPLPANTLDRSIVIRMPRRRLSEPVEEYDKELHDQEGRDLGLLLRAWFTRHGDTFSRRPDNLPSVDDRSKDIWRGLIGIGDAAGPRWATAAREALSALVSIRSALDDVSMDNYLSAISTVFATTTRWGHGCDGAKGEGLPFAEIALRLKALDDNPFAEHNGTSDDTYAKSIRPQQLSRWVTNFDIPRVRLQWTGSGGQTSRPRGILRDDFNSLFERYQPAAEPADAPADEPPRERTIRRIRRDPSSSTQPKSGETPHPPEREGNTNGDGNAAGEVLI